MQFLISVLLLLAILTAVIAIVKFLAVAIGLVLLIFGLGALLSLLVKGPQG